MIVNIATMIVSTSCGIFLTERCTSANFDLSTYIFIKKMIHKKAVKVEKSTIMETTKICGCVFEN